VKPHRRPLDLSKSLDQCGVPGNAIVDVEFVVPSRATDSAPPVSTSAPGWESPLGAGGGSGAAVKIALCVVGGGRAVLDVPSSSTLRAMLERFASVVNPASIGKRPVRGRGWGLGEGACVRVWGVGGDRSLLET